MKAKLTVFLFAVFAIGSYLSAQNRINSLQNLSPDKPLNQNHLTKTFQTAQGIASYVPGQYYREDFENEAFPPAGWQIRHIAGTYAWGEADLTYYTGNKGAVLQSYSSASLDWLITMQYSANSGDSLVFFLNPNTAFGEDSFYVMVSLEENIPADNDSLDVVFTDTLMIIDIKQITEESYWHKFSASLDKYAGQNIYIGFKNVNTTTCVIYLDRVCLGNPEVNDIALNSATYIKTARPHESQIMKASFVNNGSDTQMFEAILEIPTIGFNSVRTIESLSPNELIEVEFDEWAPETAGNYEVKIYSICPADEIEENNAAEFNISCYNYLSNFFWQDMPALPFKLRQHGTASYYKADSDPETYDSAYIYVVGGETETGFNNKVLRYDAANYEWTEMGPMPENKSGISAHQIDGKIYIFGGQNESLPFTKSLLIYDIENNSWETGADMLYACSGYSAAVYADSIIYVFGGVSGSGFLNSVQAYNIYSNTWSYASPMPYNAVITSAVSAGNMVIIAGGGGEETEYFDDVYYGEIDLNDPLNITWTSGKFPGGGCLNMASGSWYGKNMKYAFFAGGGSEENGYITSVWVYDIQKKEWFIGPEMEWSITNNKNLIAVYENGNVSMAKAGGISRYGITADHDWLYLGEDEPLSLKGADVAAKSFNSSKKIDINKGAALSVSFINNKLGPQTFDVIMKITPGEFVSVKTINGLGFNETADVLFDNWIPDSTGSYIVTVYADLAGDEDSGNDTLIVDIKVQELIQGSAWHSETAMPEGLYWPGSAYYIKKSGDDAKPDTGYVYILGGFGETDLSDKIYKYNTISRAWSVNNISLPEGMSNFHSVQIGGKIYIPGPYSYANDSSLYIYDIEADTITKGAPLPYPSSNYAMGTYGDSLIYLMGGAKGSDYVNFVMIYNINKNEWAYGTPFTGYPRYGLGGSICGNKIVLAGGYGIIEGNYIETSAVDIGVINPDNPYTISWTNGAGYPAGPCYELSSGSWYGKDKKYVCFTGGYRFEDGDVVLAETWIYDTEKDKWIAAPDKISSADAPSNMAAVVRNDSVYMAVFGGWNTNYTENLKANEWLYIGPDDSPSLYKKDAASISVDFDTVHVNQEFTPIASFINNDDAIQTFLVTMEITPGDYISVDTIVSLPYNTTAQVEFAKWTPDSAGTYTVKVYTSLAGDEVKSNDTLTASVVSLKNIGVEDEAEAPVVYSLSQNYPNPFNPTTIIKYSVAEEGMVELKVYNILGQEVKTLVNEYMIKGRYDVSFNAGELNLSSGVYIYRIKAGSFVQTKKLMLIK